MPAVVVAEEINDHVINVGLMQIDTDTDTMAQTNRNKGGSNERSTTAINW